MNFVEVSIPSRIAPMKVPLVLHKMSVYRSQTYHKHLYEVQTYHCETQIYHKPLYEVQTYRYCLFKRQTYLKNL